MDAYAVEVEGLEKHFGTVRAVDGVSFRVAPGVTLGLLGGNGAGKTTTLGMLAGLITPSAGTVRVLGHDMGPDRHAALARMNFQSPYTDLPKRLTVMENLRVYARLYGIPDREARLARLVADLHLGEFRNRAVGQLSAGQKTRVSLAKSLINDPAVLLLDEPTASLDPDTADWVRSYLESYQRSRQATIILASHNMAEVERLAGTVLMMKEGRIVDSGAPAALIERYGRATMEEVFLDIARGDAMPPLAATAGEARP